MLQRRSPVAQGGAVRGAVYRIAAPDWPAVYAYLIEHEQPTETYVEGRVRVRVEDGRALEAVTFLSDPHHPQWAGVLEPEMPWVDSVKNGDAPAIRPASSFCRSTAVT